eukprot:TRINITY_DN3322_c0_g2_i1.p2 TRINITY_DN3322_c0_g2~~TRINITY_DN3322_c0_g2_i1.p2  ORF type:complete len:263 (+),score=57.43 TRINITY_DN3322_c0_g2_i1:1863-2651(+)
MEKYCREALPFANGAFGELYSATLIEAPHRKVALKKILNRSQINLVHNEIQACKRFDHPSIPKFYENFYQGDDLYLAFELLEDCKDAFQFLQERRFHPVPEATSKKLFLQLVRALQHVHERNVCHMDIKLDNIMISNDHTRAYLIDFGLCRRNDPDHLSRWFVGSSEYTAPEIIRQVPYSPARADVHSLGVVFYALVFGEFPYRLDKRLALLRHGKELPPVQASAGVPVSENLVNIILDMMVPNPHFRLTLKEVEKRLISCG